MEQLTGKTFVVIGGGNPHGICNSFVKELLKRGAKKIAVFDIIDEEVALSHLRSEHPDNAVAYHKVDVRRRADIEQAFSKVVQQFGNIDMVLNGAGILNEDKVEDCIHINVLGTIYGTECAIDNMSITNGHKGGIIMNISSVAGLKPTQHMPVYGASKHAIIGYTKSLGAFSAPTGIKFLVVCPGITVTAMSKTMGDHFYRTDILPVDVDRYVNLLPRQSSEECAALMVDLMGKSDDTIVWVIKENVCKPAVFAVPY